MSMGIHCIQTYLMRTYATAVNIRETTMLMDFGMDVVLWSGKMATSTRVSFTTVCDTELGSLLLPMGLNTMAGGDTIAWMATVRVVSLMATYTLETMSTDDGMAKEDMYLPTEINTLANSRMMQCMAQDGTTSRTTSPLKARSIEAEKKDRASISGRTVPSTSYDTLAMFASEKECATVPIGRRRGSSRPQRLRARYLSKRLRSWWNA
mmetsp:Transcript_4008/g.7874  ORF Transcript_4008/g.7874 Transcript_4008/m.7874 type:complete len:208 (+) Transcript_4008:484-1107(+)